MVEDYTIVGVRFSAFSSTYHYKTEHVFEVGDLAVVNVNNDWKVVQVTHIDVLEKEQPKFEYKWIVCKVEREAYDQRIEEERCKHPTRL